MIPYLHDHVTSSAAEISESWLLRALLHPPERLAVPRSSSNLGKPLCTVCVDGLGHTCHTHTFFFLYLRVIFTIRSSESSCSYSHWTVKGTASNTGWKLTETGPWAHTKKKKKQKNLPTQLLSSPSQEPGELPVATSHCLGYKVYNWAAYRMLYRGQKKTVGLFAKGNAGNDRG